MFNNFWAIQNSVQFSLMFCNSFNNIFMIHILKENSFLNIISENAFWPLQLTFTIFSSDQWLSRIFFSSLVFLQIDHKILYFFALQWSLKVKDAIIKHILQNIKDYTRLQSIQRLYVCYTRSIFKKSHVNKQFFFMMLK